MVIGEMLCKAGIGVVVLFVHCPNNRTVGIALAFCDAVENYVEKWKSWGKIWGTVGKVVLGLIVVLRIGH